MKSRLEEKSPKESKTETCYLVLPSHTNAIGSIFGGTIMSWVDITAAICAQRHSGRTCVTASVDAIHFHDPIGLGDTVICRAKVVHTGRSSMVVAVEVDTESPHKPKHRRSLEAILTFVALDHNRKPVAVPPLKLETKEEKRAFEEAAARRQSLLKQKKASQGSKTKN